MTTVNNKKIIIAATEISTGGLGSYLRTLARGLKLRGWEVHVLATHAPGDLYGSMEEVAACQELSAHTLSRKKIFKAADVVNNISPDILLMNNCSLMHYALPLIRATTKPIAVLHSDDVRFYRTSSFFSKRIFRWIAPTQGVADRGKTYLSLDRKKDVRTIPHGIEPEAFHTAEKGRRKTTGKICFVGFIAENKGADLLPEIILRVSSKYNNASLTIVGHGPLEQTLKERFKENGTLDKCHFTGAISHEEVGAILSNSDILLLPTRIEGFGLTIVEAMMSGAVPVVSRLKGITDDIVDDGMTGLLIEPDDTNGFADAIAGLLRNPAKLISMSEAAKKISMEKYASVKMLDAYESLFAEADDRMVMSRRGMFGWIAETMCEKVKTGMSRQWVLDRAKEIWT